MISLHLIVSMHTAVLNMNIYPFLHEKGVTASLGLAVGDLALTEVSPGRHSSVLFKC